MHSSPFVPVQDSDLLRLREIAGADNVIVDVQGVETLSKDYYWYSPILVARLEEKRASAAVKVSTFDVLREVVAVACRARLPITVRGSATGNYGQCVPLYGGLVLDVSGMDKIFSIVDGVAHTEPGAKLGQIETRARPLGYELRCYPSTWVKASVGGFIGGGSGGVGSISWGGLRDIGTIKRLKVLTVEEEPRTLIFEESEALTVFHAYGTNGIIVEVELRLAPARAWDQVILASPSFDTLLDFTEALAKDDALPKRLVSMHEEPLPSFFLPIKKFYPPGHALTFLEVEASHTAEVKERAERAGVLVPHTIPYHEPRRAPMLSDYTWNHTTLWAIKSDKAFTYLQCGFGDNFREQFAALRSRFPGEILLHLEFVRGSMRADMTGEVQCGGLPVVRFKDEARLNEIIAYCREIGVFVANPHTFFVEEGGRDFNLGAQRALKAQTDPHGLLNPGKLKSYPHNPFAHLSPSSAQKIDRIV